MHNPSPTLCKFPFSPLKMHNLGLCLCRNPFFPPKMHNPSPTFCKFSAFPLKMHNLVLTLCKFPAFPSKMHNPSLTLCRNPFFSLKMHNPTPGIAQNQTTYLFHSQVQNRKERKVSSSLLMLPSLNYLHQDNETKLCFTALHNLHYFLLHFKIRARAQLYTCCSIRYSTRRATTTNRPFSV